MLMAGIIPLQKRVSELNIRLFKNKMNIKKILDETDTFKGISDYDIGWHEAIEKVSEMLKIKR